ncbi:MAG TPA: AbrB/MazE/SpoVT family DNA-binding domain-containing protein [Candidatus Sulfotelmatobacter sp.]|nr:AbrB/MazE/SpoVT family DNA-binding domain-containing protein [Candidatus Sulfotelmatobacter sp.]
MTIHVPYYKVRKYRDRKDHVPTATITSKGQITIPVRVRAALGVDSGDRIEFVELEKGQFAIIPATRSLQELNGRFKGRRKTAATIEEMDEAIAKGAAESL